LAGFCRTQGPAKIVLYERFAFFRLADNQKLEEMADFVGACATQECSLRFRRAQLFF
jgi:hypothetical protein